MVFFVYNRKMTADVVNIEGVQYESSTSIAKRFGYTSDYVSRLAREGKIISIQIERRWYVVETSLNHFIQEVKIKRQLQNEETRAERKLTLLLKRKQSSSKNKTHNNNLSTVKGQSGYVEPNKKINIFLAATGSSLVMVAGLLLAIVSNPQSLVMSYFVSSNIQEGVMAANISVVHQTSADRSLTIDSLFDHEVAPRFGMVLIPESGTTSPTSIRNSFSDDVKMRFQNVNTGIVQPQFKSGPGEDYIFIMVPVESS